LHLSESVKDLRGSILAIIVLYKTRPSDSAAFETIQVAADALKDRRAIQILLYDNTPGGCDPGPLPEGVSYEAAEQNAGLATAYNHALTIAEREDAAWLLLLDQDTTLPIDYLSRMGRLATELESDETIAVIVPRMLDAGRPVAPAFIRFWGLSYLPATFRGASAREIHSINSASLFRVNALRWIGGFSPYFWLDYADAYIFHQIYLNRMTVYVANDVEVRHQLSLLHRGELTPDRFRNILRAESAYWDLYGGTVQRLFLAARLFGRIGRQRKRGHDSSILQLTWNELKRRIFQSRRRRIQDWKREMVQRIENSRKDTRLSVRPSVSVCMAAYNGERYIAEQLQSILSQLVSGDEVILVDDASTDDTKAKVRLFNDGRIRLIEHNRNMGVASSFQDAIGAASGEILFLSDQDDLWESNRVSAVLDAFRLHPEVDVVVSDASLINEDGFPIGASYYAHRGRFRAGVLANVLRCSYLGCTMAFRHHIRAKILPLPSADILHDLWIGASNALLGGRTLYVNAPLVRYRRHASNATGNKRLSSARRIRMRWELCRCLARIWLKNDRAVPTASFQAHEE
jgi:glycosyltransferase involved in cell wall biosynthesis